ncbi:MAG: alkaline phosphatase family protein [Bdellovibrionales bacterium]|nr:alkaline phosphatase family protein [Bdellovibrionales bacterium]
MKKGLVVLLSFWLVSCLSLDKGHSEYSGYSILQGPTTQNETIITVLYPKNRTLNYKVEVETPEGFKAFSSSNVKKSLNNYNDSDYTVARLDINNLEPNKKYRLLFLNSRRELIDNRTFYALSDKDPLKISLVSCMNDQYEKEQEPMWKTLIDTNPDMVFMIGDNVYADAKLGVLFKGGVTPQDIWKRYEQTRNSLYIYRQKKLIPTYATWDDHDYGTNNGGKDFKYKKQAKEIFETFFPQTEQSNFKKGPGVSSLLSFNNYSFYFLDNRSFRDKKNPSGQHFGKEQSQWIQESVKKLNSKYVFFISGDQFFGAYHRFESFEGHHSKTFKEFLNKLKSIQNKKIIFVSGDRHLSEVMEIESTLLGYKTYEITSSGIHSSVYPGSFEKDPNPRQIAGKDGVHNFINLNLERHQESLNLKVESLGKDGKLYFKESLNL